MAQIFLMGTAGSYDDPKRSMWREPIKEACNRLGVECFDPVIPVWNEEAGRREVEAMYTARILVMAITSDTAGVASLSESGWAVLSAILRKQSVGMFVDPSYRDETLMTTTVFIRNVTRVNSGTETIEDASLRARKLVRSHAAEISKQFPTTSLYVAKDLPDLTAWVVAECKKLKLGSK